MGATEVPALRRSRLRGVRSFRVRGGSVRASFLVAGALVSCSFRARVDRTENSNTPITAHKNLFTHPSRLTKITDAPRGTATVPLLLPAHMVQSGW